MELTKVSCCGGAGRLEAGNETRERSGSMMEKPE